MKKIREFLFIILCAFLLVGTLIFFLNPEVSDIIFKTHFSLKPKVTKIEVPVSIKEMENQELWRGVVTGNISTAHGYGLVEVINPLDNLRVFRLMVVYTSIASTPYILRRWKVGQEILFCRTVVSSKSGQDFKTVYCRSAEIGLFVTTDNWKDVVKDRYRSPDCKIANPPDKK